jgi:hypothetical protein
MFWFGINSAGGGLAVTQVRSFSLDWDTANKMLDAQGHLSFIRQYS